jgi:hypothetical protein
MTQPTFTDGPPVPLMVEGTLDAAGLRQLFADIQSAGTVLDVREKGGPAEYAGGAGLTPAAALERLLAGAARAVQVRYRYEGHDWTDTVFATAQGFRVIRCQHG